MAGATHPAEITVASAKWSICWSLRERVVEPEWLEQERVRADPQMLVALGRG
jgi:hypothetical protein